jgi:hypothetical protein
MDVYYVGFFARRASLIRKIAALITLIAKAAASVPSNAPNRPSPWKRRRNNEKNS